MASVLDSVGACAGYVSGRCFWWEHSEHGVTLAEIAVNSLTRCVDDVLLRELEADPAFAADHWMGDASRVHLAFLRWQQLVFFERASSLSALASEYFF